MNLIELERALRQLRLGGIATVLESQGRPIRAPAATRFAVKNDSDRLLARDSYWLSPHAALGFDVALRRPNVRNVLRPWSSELIQTASNPAFW